MTKRSCSFVKASGQPCNATPMAEGGYCFWHSPDHQEEAQEARRLGGLRRRREKTVAVAYDFEGLASVDDIRRLLEIAVVDALGLDNSTARCRTIGYLAGVAVKLLETGDLEQRIADLEAAVQGRPAQPESLFDSDPSGDSPFVLEVTTE